MSERLDDITKLLHTRIDFAESHPNVTPLFQNSAFLSESQFFYSRKANPNTSELETALSHLEDGAEVISVTNGMAAIQLALRLLRPGQTLLINELIYGCTFKLFQDYCEHFGITLRVEDLSQPDVDFSGVDMVFFETPTNPFLKNIPIERTARELKTKSKDALVVVDNTWATPYFQKPLNFGADLCVYSATKFYAGHSDCMGGMVTCRRADLAEKVRSYRFYSGAVLDPHSAWLIRRSLQTFGLRMREHQRVTGEMAQFLSQRKEIERVYLPEIDGKELTGYGGILFIELRKEHEARASSFVTSLKLFQRGTSMASVVSAVAQPFSGSHLSLSAEEKDRMKITPRLIRLCFGFESPDDLKRDLGAAFEKL